MIDEEEETRSVTAAETKVI